ncbi:minor head protein [Pseudomonas phage WP1]
MNRWAVRRAGGTAGFSSINDARSGYLSCFRPGWDGLGSIH